VAPTTVAELPVAQQLQEVVLAVVDGLLVEDQEVLGGGDSRPSVRHVQVRLDSRLPPDGVLVQELLGLLQLLLLHLVLLALEEEVVVGRLDVEDHRQDRALEVEVRDPDPEPGVLDAGAVVVRPGAVEQGLGDGQRYRAPVGRDRAASIPARSIRAPGS
jgi:hypothetical protein